MRTKNYIFEIVIAIVTAAAALLMWIGYPGYFSYQEQYQLFLWDAGYWAERIAVIGGLANYIGEFLTQFYYMPTTGAIIIALLAALLQLMSYLTIPNKARSNSPLFCAAFSSIPAFVWLSTLGDENFLLSLPCAILLALSATAAFNAIQINNAWLRDTFRLLCLLPLYYLIGPASVLFLLLTQRTRRIYGTIALAIIYALFVIILHRCCFQQYLLDALFLGINYYRVPELHPTLAIVTLGCFAVVPLVAWLVCTKRQTTIAIQAIAAIVCLGLGIWLSAAAIDKDKMQVFKYDYLVRIQDWNQIIKTAEQKTPDNDFCLQALNLALAKTGQLNDRLFEFPQNGIASLLDKYHNDNTSGLITAEAFYHLGMVNSALRYSFDLQEAIMNNRKSGRLMRRIASCMIINGKYRAAAKYTDMLKKSLFYRDWAEKAEEYFNDEERINATSEWGNIRRLRFKDEFLYYYPEIVKILAKLAVNGDTPNKLAWDYFCAAAMLQGDLQTLAGLYHYANENYGIKLPPKHVQEALAMFWTFGHQNFDGIPFNISNQVKQQISMFAQSYSASPNNPNAWKSQFPATFYTYFLSKQQNKEQTDDINGSHRAD